MDLEIDVAKTALLVLDMQKHMIDEASPLAQHTGFAEMVKEENIVERVGKVLDAARAAGMFVGYVVVDFANAPMPQYPDRGDFCRNIKVESEDLSVLRPGVWGYEIDERIAPKAGEPIVPKGHVSAFAASELDAVLRREKITDLALVGVATSFVVTGTVWTAVTLGYSCLVIKDCCAAQTRKLHEAAIEGFAPVADLCAADEFVKAVSSHL